MFKYLPVNQRTPDNQYKALLREILDQGVRTDTQLETDALTLMGAKPMHFKLENGFPMITERKISEKMWTQAVGEILGFINGARTLKQLEEFGCFWWAPWGTEAKCKKRGLETGDLGPGSYGAAFHDFPTSEGKPHNQFKDIIEQIKEKPHLRTHFITPWIPQYIARGEGKQQKVVVCPCHGWIHLRVLNGKLTLHMFQRSGDVPVGVPANMVQYAALLMAIAQVTGLEPYEYVHTISDAHIYVDQISRVEEMLGREDRVFPTMTLKNKHQDIFKYRHTDFELSDYNPHPGIWDFPVSI
ncbi:MAG: thymidylate synthase [Candidatus Paceibacterota bacterium]